MERRSDLRNFRAFELWISLSADEAQNQSFEEGGVGLDDVDRAYLFGSRRSY